VIYLSVRLTKQELTNTKIKNMKFYSTKNKDYKVDLKTAVLRSLPPDNGLYMPEQINKLSKEFFKSLPNLSFSEIGYAVTKNLIGDSVPDHKLREIVNNAINFEAPLVSITDEIKTLELWHGPSLAFKDFGARFMAQLMSYLVEGEKEKLTILVATSGDTGGAVAAGFYGIKNIEVVILYPKGKVSPLQELQLTTWGGNIRAVEIDGTFDDCQAIVKEAFLDQSINEEKKLSSANSINIARLIPQSFYYFEAYKQLDDLEMPVVFSVPSGNFGNITAGLMAKKMGLPIHKFLAATNVNDIVPAYLNSGNYEPKPSQQTISNAMDVGNPSNFRRMEDLYLDESSTWNNMKSDIIGYSYTDEETYAGIKEVFDLSGYTADPHGAVGYLALKEYLSQNFIHQGVFLETAHPAKFLPVMNQALGFVYVPEALSVLREKESKAVSLDKSYAKFKEYLLG